MSGTVDSNSSIKPVFMLYLLWLLVLCLALHFIVDDIILFSDTPTGVLSCESYDEMTHQDDLVLAVSLPEHGSDNDINDVFSDLVLLQNQIITPILQPPRI